MNEINISSLDLNLLKTFEALYEEGSASRAGLRLGITQSAVSAALKRLKQWYGDPLFVRTGRGLMPTPRAHELQPLVSDALNKCRETLTLLQPNPQAYAGRTVTLGLSDDFELALGQALIARLQQRAPGLRLVFRQAHSQIAADLLLRHELDLALTAGGFSYRSLSKVQVASGGYACLVVRDVTELSLERFIQTPHLLISHGGHIGLVDEQLAEQGLSRRIAASTTHFAAIPWLLQDDTLLATLPAHAAQAIAARAPHLRCLPCPLSMPDYAIELGFRPTVIRDSAVRLVRGTLSQLAGEFQWFAPARPLSER
ncbi:LysR family transcriptional regulator [Dickeya fangzhongdai]|uniref:LysR family transcriptional regulator n=1 Tax=Dickeya fangzhongdai TaxID=1778540 RepID=UPI000573A589|nr:LysR family transcriptional regulator [Dickeya fangzhongdai]KHN59583.1 LysR family transcriptional regulator [Dickeya fangzhongdai]